MTPVLSIGGVIALLVVGAVLLGGLVLLVIGLSNRHTRGPTITVASIAAILVLLAIGGLTLRVENSQQVAKLQAEQARVMAVEQTEIAKRRLEVQQLEGRADQYQQLANELQDNSEADAQRQALEYRQQAELLLQQAEAKANQTLPVAAQGRVGRAKTWAVLIPFSLVGVIVVMMIFKHAGSGAALATLAVPVVLVMFWSYSSVSTPATVVESSLSTTRSRPLFDGDDPQDFMASNDPIPVVINSEAWDNQESSTADSGDDAEVQPKDEGDDPIAKPASTTAADVPDWVTNPPKSVENAHRVVVSSEWWASAQVCNERIEPKIQEAVFNYLKDEATEERPHPYVPSLDRLGITNRFIRDNLVADQYYSTKDFEHESAMVNQYVLLEFNDNATQTLLASWRDYARRENVLLVSLAMGAILATLAGVVGLIKLDTYTKGYYTKRLFIGVPAAIIGLVLLLIVVSNV